MQGYRFMLACHEDIDEIVSIYHGLIDVPGCTWDFEYPSQKTAESDVCSNSLYILKKLDQIVAVASAGDFGELDHLPWSLEKPSELARIGVMAAMQNQGVGSFFLRCIMQDVQKRKFDGIRLLVSQTNPAAIAMYEKNGFKACGPIRMHGIDFLRYQVTLNALDEA